MDRVARNDRACVASRFSGNPVRERRGNLRPQVVARILALAAIAGASACGGHAPSPIVASIGATPPNIRALPTATPAPAWTSSQRAALARTLSSIFSDDITEHETGIVVASAEGATLFDRRGSVPVAPASTLKLVVGATALNRLGPKHRFETRFVALGPPGDDGVLRGGLWLVGGGDPSLTSDDLKRGVGVLSRSGIRQIDGTLAIDDTAFSGPEQNPRWDPDDLDYDYAAGTSAISLDEDTVEFDVTPDPNGGPAHVKPVPDNDSITFSGSIATVGSSGDSFVSIERKVEAPTFGASEAEAAETEPSNEYVLDGRIVQGTTQQFYKPVLGMPGYVGGVVAAMLQERGIDLAGGYRAGAAPSDAVPLWQHRSGPLEDIEHEMLVNSNNHTAETFLRIVGETSGHPGTDAAGIAVEKNELSRLGVPHDHMTLYDGSGLAPTDRIMPLTLAKLLSAETRSAYGDTFVRSLARVGIEGTVKSHNLTDAAGRVRAKSGHIEGVNGLAGVVQTKHHGRVSFAFIVNSSNANAGDVYDEMDRALDAIADS